MYVEQGRLDDAGMLFAVLRERAQGDVWLYNSAAWAYGSVEPATSLRWALDGIDKAFETGDPDRVIDQLRDFAVQAWTALGLPVDDALLAQVDEFVAVWEPVTARPETSHASPLTPSSAPKRVAAAARAGTAYGMAWFPATEWASATRRWPDLLDHAPAEHQAYCRIIEARLKTLHRTAPGISQHVSPITVSELDALATNSGEDAGTGTVRSHLAAEVVRTGRAVAWPPKRNDRCWCGSGRKYKQCCGPTPASILGEETDG